MHSIASVLHAASSVRFEHIAGTRSRTQGWPRSLHRPPATSKHLPTTRRPPLRLLLALHTGRTESTGLAKIRGPDAAAATAETAKEPPVSKTARRLLEKALRVRAPQFSAKHAPRLDALARERAGRSTLGPDPAAAGLTGAEPVAATVDAVGGGASTRATTRATSSSSITGAGQCSKTRAPSTTARGRTTALDGWFALAPWAKTGMRGGRPWPGCATPSGCPRRRARRID